MGGVISTATAPAACPGACADEGEELGWDAGLGLVGALLALVCGGGVTGAWTARIPRLKDLTAAWVPNEMRWPYMGWPRYE